MNDVKLYLRRFAALSLIILTVNLTNACTGSNNHNETSTESAQTTETSETVTEGASETTDSLTVHITGDETTSRETTTDSSRSRTTVYTGSETSSVSTETPEATAPTADASGTLEVPSWTTSESAELDQLLSKAAGAFVVDLRSGERLLWQENTETIETASIGKLTTALFARTIIDPEEIIAVGDEVSLISPTSSLAFVSKGMRLSFTMMTEGMMLPSGNDAAYAVAAAGGRRLRGVDDLGVAPEGGLDQATRDVERFMEALNEWAQEQGMKDSTWIHPDGYRSEDQWTTLADMVVLGELAAADEELLRITAMPSDKVMYASGETMTWTNGNQLINRDSPYFRNGIIGLKTGSFFDYFNVLVLEREEGGSQHLIGVFGLPYSKDRFDLATLLYDEFVD